MATHRVIEVKAVKIETITLTIEGTSPLLCNKFSTYEQNKLLRTQQGEKVPREPKDPEACYKRRIYQADEGWYGFPAAGIKESCVGACRFVPSLPMTEARGSFFVMYRGFDYDTKQQLVVLNGEPLIDQSMVRVGRGVADVRFRPVFFPWTIEFDVRFNPHVITDNAIAALVQLAGFHQGIGDYRPERSGTNGMFQLKE